MPLLATVTDKVISGNSFGFTCCSSNSVTIALTFNSFGVDKIHTSQVTGLMKPH